LFVFRRPEILTTVQMAHFYIFVINCAMFCIIGRSYLCHNCLRL